MFSQYLSQHVPSETKTDDCYGSFRSEQATADSQQASRGNAKEKTKDGNVPPKQRGDMANGARLEKEKPSLHQMVHVTGFLFLQFVFI
jgi:hypothetical protein